MPELPEVETVRRTLKNFVCQRKITDIIIRYNNIVTDDNDLFIHALKNKTIQDIDRVGKYLIFIVEDQAFVSHLRMEGKYNIVDASMPYTKHEHVIFVLDNDKHLRYHDTRKFGRMELVDVTKYRQQLPLLKLGPEPSQALVQDIYPKIHKSHLPIKTLLLDQSIMAGIGNIYANEICFKMKINPYTQGDKLTKKRVQEVIDVSKQILDTAINQGGTTIHSFDANGITGLFQVQLSVHLQKECSVCHTALKKEMIKGRGTYYCPICQRRKS